MSVNTYIGVDVSKHTFDACFADGETVRSFPNTERGVSTFLRTCQTLSANHSQLIIGFESTSHYHYLLAMRTKEKGYQPILINPLITNKYSQRNIRKTKTDKLDATVIRYCTLQGEGYPFTETAETLTLKQLVRERQYLSDLKNILHLRHDSTIAKSQAVKQAIPSVSPDIITSVEQKMKEIEKQLKQYHQPTQTLLQSIPGVGPLTSAACISEIQDIQRFKEPKHLIAFIGTDPKVHQSGSSIDKYRRISKRGNKILRTRLYNATSVAVQRPNQFQTYFKKKKDQGKPFRVALIATANKMARVIHSVWTNNRPYQEPKVDT